MLTMQAGDIWRKDTTTLHPTNTVQHWLILDIEMDFGDRVIVKYLHLENGIATDSRMKVVDLQGNPYYKKVA